MDYPPIPQFCLDFLLRSKGYLKEHPPSVSFANRNFPLSSKPEYVVRLVLQTQQGAAAQWFTLVQGA